MSDDSRFQQFVRRNFENFRRLPCRAEFARKIAGGEQAAGGETGRDGACGDADARFLQKPVVMSRVPIDAADRIIGLFLCK